MNILITGGNTLIPIDKVRGITNIFRGRTACNIAAEGLKRGHDVTLLGNPGMEQGVCYVDEEKGEARGAFFAPYKTYDELYAMMERRITHNNYDCIIHSAAVSDYKVVKVTGCRPEKKIGPAPDHPGKDQYEKTTDYDVDKSGKISSNYEKMYLELVPTAKIVDKIRNPWGFKGTLVKFKLQVDMTDDELLAIARQSRVASDADIIVANCLEWSRERAYIVTDVQNINVQRPQLATELLDHIEAIRK